MAELKRELAGKTIIGEYIGHPDFQHLVRYKKIQITWFGLVNNKNYEICYPIKESRKFFDKYGLPASKILF